MPGIAARPVPVKKVDPTHPEAKAISDMGIPIERLTQLVNNAPKGITHEAVSDEQTAANELASAQQTQTQGITIPPLDTQGFQAASELGPMFAQMLQGIITPPVPNEPDFASPTPTGSSNG